MGIAGNHWDGMSKGTHQKTGRIGLFPSYKVVNSVQAVVMPTYPEVPLTAAANGGGGKARRVEEEEEEGDGEGARWEKVAVAVDYGHR